MEENLKCYNFKKIVYNKGTLDNCSDATYVIHLLGNGRIDSVNKQLEKYKPNSTCYILENPGYKKCKKKLAEQTPPHDLMDAFLQVLKHAKRNKYKNVLILEDDFEFSDNILNTNITQKISSFLNENVNVNLVYYLGTFPWIRANYYNYHNRVLMSSGTHAIIYTEKGRDYMLDNFTNSSKDWDLYINNLYGLKRYCYYKPLCYQLCTQTENSSHWIDYVGNVKMMNLIFKQLQLDKTVEPGTSRLYKLSDFIVLLMLLLILYLLNKRFNFVNYILSVIKRK